MSGKSLTLSDILETHADTIHQDNYTAISAELLEGIDEFIVDTIVYDALGKKKRISFTHINHDITIQCSVKDSDSSFVIFVEETSPGITINVNKHENAIFFIERSEQIFHINIFGSPLKNTKGFEMVTVQDATLSMHNCNQNQNIYAKNAHITITNDKIIKGYSVYLDDSLLNIKAPQITNSDISYQEYSTDREIIAGKFYLSLYDISAASPEQATQPISLTLQDYADQRKATLTISSPDLHTCNGIIEGNLYNDYAVTTNIKAGKLITPESHGFRPIHDVNVTPIK